MHKSFYLNLINSLLPDVFILCLFNKKKLYKMILVRHYDLFLPDCGGHDSTADN